MVGEAKVTMATMHIVDNAIQVRRHSRWSMYCGHLGELKTKTRLSIFPENVEIIARRKLREVMHTTNIRDYVKQFSRLLLDIHDMFEKDKVFNFVEGVKQWTKIKLYEQSSRSFHDLCYN